MPWHLIGLNLREHWLRTALTMGSIAVAVFLLTFLRTVLVAMNAGIEASASNRLIVQSAVSLFVDLPLSYQAKIEAVPGVGQVCKQQWFGAQYGDGREFFAQFGVDHDRFFAAFPEVQLIEGRPEDFSAKPTACVIGKELAARFGWKPGSKVPLIGTIFPRTDGLPWEFDVVGIYESKASNVDNSTMWFRFDYLVKSEESGAVAGPIMAGIYAVNLAKGADPVAVAARIDELFANGPQRVQASPEAEFQRQFLTMMGNIPFFLNSIGGAVLFAILLAAINTMLMSFRQRTHEFGVLKALGFTDATAAAMMAAESFVVATGGGLIGLAAMLAAAPSIAKGMATMFPTFVVTGETIALGLALSAGLGALAGILPAWRASRLDCVEALRAEV